MYDATFTGWWQWVVDILLGLTMDKLSVAVGKNLTLAETVTYVQTKLATSISKSIVLGRYLNSTKTPHHAMTISQLSHVLRKTRASSRSNQHQLGLQAVTPCICRMVHQNKSVRQSTVHTLSRRAGGTVWTRSHMRTLWGHPTFQTSHSHIRTDQSRVSKTGSIPVRETDFIVFFGIWR